MLAVEECAESVSYIDHDHDQEHAHDIPSPDLMSSYGIDGWQGLWEISQLKGIYAFSNDSIALYRL